MKSNHVHAITLMARRRFSPANVLGALNAASAAMSYVRKGAGVVRKIGNYTQNLKRAANRVFRPTYRRLRYRKAVPRFRKRRRLFRRRLRRRRVKGVPSIPRRNVYTKNRKGIRRGNVGILSLQKRIQAGHTLPVQTFARMYFRASGSTYFDNTNTYSNGRVLVLNRINAGPVAGSSVGTNTTTTPSLYGHVMYKKFWDTLYEDYLVLGATCRIKINPVAYPSTLAGRDANGTSSDTGMPDNIQPGYWYARVSYRRLTSGTEIIGHSIPMASTSDERLWAHERDFLADPTVIWVRDRSRVKSKVIRTNVQQGIHGESVNVSTPTSIVEDGLYRVSHETELSTRPIYLRVNFSAKKHYDVKDIMNEGPWVPMANNPGEGIYFRVRIGYIGFDSNGTNSYHVPLDRVREKEVSYDIKYFVALRGPKINPNMYTDMENLARIEARRKGIAIEEAETDVPSDDDDDFLSELEDEFDPPDEVAEGGMPPDDTV